MATQLGFYVPLNNSYAEALEKVISALKSEGFGVLTRIDVKATMKEKLGVEFRRNVTVEAGDAGGSVVRIHLERVAQAVQQS